MIPYIALASMHHLLAFLLFAALIAELALIRPGVSVRDIRTLFLTDAFYGAAFVLLVVFGFMRVYFGESGHHHYFDNMVFWAKMGVFAFIAALSIWPTATLFRWRSALKKDGAFRPADNVVRRVRGFVIAEATLFALIPVLAAMLARGYGA